jgi:hypothetical protein
MLHASQVLPPRGTTVRVGATSPDDCVCPPRYILMDHSCVPCMQGMICDVAGMTLATARLDKGFWRSGPESTALMLCPNR